MNHAAVTSRCPEGLVRVMQALCAVSADLASLVARGPLAGTLGQAVGDNFGGDQQKELDVIADQAFATALRGTGVRHYASEERDAAETLDDDGDYALAIDPLDGSSNIEVNVSIGSIFSIYQAAGDPNASFLRPGSEQIAAGYVIYGPQTALYVSYGEGVASYILDPQTRSFELVAEQVSLPAESSEFAINASNYRHWPNPIRAYVDDCLAGSAGPRGKDFNMRWIASLVAETHRILSRGGIFLYPADRREGYARGRLRHVYECAPIAMLIEQAGGMATDGSHSILKQTPKSLHERTPFVFGTRDKVLRVRNYNDLPDKEVSALFGKRGLFRS